MISGFYIIPNYPLPQLSAAVGFSETAVQAPEVVGYFNADTEMQGQLVTMPFQTIELASEHKFKLSDLRITGYQDNEFLKSDESYGIQGAEFQLVPLTGSMAFDESQSFYWYDPFDCDDTQTWEGGCWSPQGSLPIEEAENKLGEGFWLYIDYNAEPQDEIKLVSSGEVPPIDVLYEPNMYGNVIGNPMPCAVPLTSITVNGYQDNEFLKSDESYGIQGAEFQLVPVTGSMAFDESKSFYWYDPFDCDDTQTWEGGCWSAQGSVEADEVTVEPGQSYWFYMDYYAEPGDHITVEIPSPLVDHTADPE